MTAGTDWSSTWALSVMEAYNFDRVSGTGSSPVASTDFQSVPIINHHYSNQFRSSNVRHQSLLVPAFEARRRAEAAPGVGSRLTDLIYIGREIGPFDEELMEKFKSAYETLRQREDESRSTWRMVMRPAADAPDGETTMEETDAGQN